MYLTVKKIQNSNQKIVEIKSMPLQTHMTVHSHTSITNNLAIYGQTFHFRHMYLYSQSDFRYNNLALYGQHSILDICIFILNLTSGTII